MKPSANDALVAAKQLYERRDYEAGHAAEVRILAEILRGVGEIPPQTRDRIAELLEELAAPRSRGRASASSYQRANRSFRWMVICTRVDRWFVDFLEWGCRGALGLACKKVAEECNVDGIKRFSAATIQRHYRQFRSPELIRRARQQSREK